MTTSINRSLTNLSTKPEEYFSQPRPEMVRFIPKSAKKILDIGCGEGVFGGYLKKTQDAEVWGVELVSSVAESARQRLDHVLSGDIMQALQTLENGYFDCAICNDVIEHLVDPYAMLTALKKKLKPDGVVVCSIPNIRYFRYLFKLAVLGEWRYEEGGILDKTHLRFFTKKSIREMFQSLGYEILEMEGINATPSWRVALLNTAMFGFLADTKFLQFAVVARPLAGTAV